MKKFLSILLAAMLVLGMVGTAFATEVNPTTYAITINQPLAGHIYEAYQIFSGTLSTTGVLSDIAWGTGVTEEGQNFFGDAETKAGELKTTDDARTFADALDGYLGAVAASTNAQVDGVYVIEGLTPGYYLVKDSDDSLSDANDAYTLYIMCVVSNVTATPKGSVPTSQKKVKDVNDSIDEAYSVWQDSGDWDIGDDVPFQISGTLASNFASYDVYKVVFHDEQSAGLDTPKDFKAYAVNAAGVTVAEFREDTDYTVAVNDNDFTVTFNDLTANVAVTADCTIYVEYTSRLNESAVLGSAGNPNEMYMEFSNNPYADTETDNETGKTPRDKVIVFTYKLVVNKVDGTGAALNGAEFKLEKMDATGTTVIEDLVLTVEGNVFSFSGLDDGTYRITETKAPEGFNKLEDPIVFTVSATHDSLSDDPKLTAFTGNTVSGDATFVYTAESGKVETTIQNQAGATLPSTGGIGTTIFYLLGSIMFIGAAMTLVVRRRADAEEV